MKETEKTLAALLVARGRHTVTDIILEVARDMMKQAVLETADAGLENLKVFEMAIMTATLEEGIAREEMQKAEIKHLEAKARFSAVCELGKGD